MLNYSFTIIITSPQSFLSIFY